MFESFCWQLGELGAFKSKSWSTSHKISFHPSLSTNANDAVLRECPSTLRPASDADQQHIAMAVAFRREENPHKTSLCGIGLLIFSRSAAVVVIVAIDRRQTDPATLGWKRKTVNNAVVGFGNELLIIPTRLTALVFWGSETREEQRSGSEWEDARELSKKQHRSVPIYSWTGEFMRRE